MKESTLQHTEKSDSESMESDRPKIRSVKFNVIMNVVLVTSTYIFPLILTPYVSRVLGPEKLGDISFATTFASYFSLVAILGISTYGVRACAKVRDNLTDLSRVVHELLTILGISTTIVYVAYIVTILLFPRFASDKALFLISGTTIILSSLGMEWFYQALEQYSYITVRSIVVKAILVVLVFLLIKSPSDYRIYALLTVFGTALSNIINFLKARKLVLPRSQVDGINPLRHIKPIFHYAVSAISIGMYVQADILMLGFLGSPTMVGVYQLASKIESFAAAGANAVSSVILPRLSYYSSDGDQADYLNLFTKNLRFILIVGCLASPLLILTAEQIVLIMGGPRFLDAAMPLIAIAPGVLLISVNTALAQHMVSTEMDSAFAKLNILGLCSALLLDYILIPQFGVVGAALGSAGAELIVLIPKMWITRDVIVSTWRELHLPKIVLSTFFAVLATIFVKGFLEQSNAPLCFIVASVSYSMVYIICLTLMGEPFLAGFFGSFSRRLRHHN